MEKEGLIEIAQTKERVEAIKAGLITDPAKKGLKYDNDKIRYDLYPVDAYIGVNRVLTFGANKYTPNGWKDVKPKSRYYAALMRHLIAQIEYEEKGGSGLAVDEETGLPHLDHAHCCLVFYRELTK